MHPFDQAFNVGPQAQTDHIAGWVKPLRLAGAWFGGSTAATALRAALLHADLLGEPIPLTVNCAAATAAGALSITAWPAHINRSTQHWPIELARTRAMPSTLGLSTRKSP